MTDNPTFSHLDEQGRARMVDVSAKPVTRREAIASCRVALSAATLARIESLPKGDALAVARLAGIQAAKRTSDWVPLAHSLPLDHVGIEFEPSDKGLRIHSTVVATARTGAEMEALVACSAAALALRFGARSSPTNMPNHSSKRAVSASPTRFSANCWRGRRSDEQFFHCDAERLAANGRKPN